MVKLDGRILMGSAALELCSAAVGCEVVGRRATSMARLSSEVATYEEKQQRVA